MTPCNCDTATGECQGPLGCKAVSALVKALEEIANTPTEKDFDYDERGRIKSGSRSYSPGWAAWHFQNIARAALSAYRGEKK